jgi:nitrogen-specific signal transduction histidine kinase
MNAMAQALSENHQLLEARIFDATRELETKKDEAERSNLAKSRFLAAASHDLRQPLHALSLFAADLRHESITPAQQRLARQISESASSISELLDALLDISRLDVAGVTPVTEDYPLDEIFRRLNAGFARSAGAKSLRFRCRATPLWVHTDPALLERLLCNLLSNAIRYTEKGGVLLLARCRGGHVCIEVRDSGVGIAPEHRQPIFEEFFQVGNVARAQDRGLGLGLAIVSRLARILGLEVELRSWPGRGSVFSVTLQLAQPANRPLPSATLAPDVGSQTPRLLLLRPEAPVLQTLAELAANWGFYSDWADSFGEARERALREGMVIVGVAGDSGSSFLDSPTETEVPLILLGPPGDPRPAHVHLMPLPLRPAKLRALLTQLLPARA